MAGNADKEFAGIEGMIGDQEISRWQDKAVEYVDNPSRRDNLLTKAFRKADDNKKHEFISHIWDKVQLLFSLAKDWSNGSYKNISKSAILAIIGGMIYFVSPLDVIPDWLVGLGLVDDAAVLGLVINQMDKELTRYKEWKRNTIT